MAFAQFPNQQYFRILDTDMNTRMGYFNLQDGTELKNMMLTLFVRNSIPAPFELWMNIYGNDRATDPIFSSERAIISADTLVPSYVNNWLGNIYLDFAGYPLNPNINYFMTVETDGYVRDMDNHYIGINLDWYSEVNNQLSANEAGARIRILGKR